MRGEGNELMMAFVEQKNFKDECAATRNRVMAYAGKLSEAEVEQALRSVTRETTMEELEQMRVISSGTCTSLLIRGGIKNVDDMIAYYKKHNSFRQLNNIGEQKQMRLVQIINTVTDRQ